jgi:large subunit ribosomal protein L6
MSRIWKNPIKILSWIEVNLVWNNIVVKWQKWQLSYDFPQGVNVVVDWDMINVSVESNQYKNYWGLVRTLIANMIEWVTNGFKKELLVIWVWYNAKMQWKELVLSLWLSHPVNYQAPAWIDVTVDKWPKWVPLIRIEGIDKQKVWEITAKIRAFRKPEPYKGKGIRYIDEVIKLKQWKKAGK